MNNSIFDPADETDKKLLFIDRLPTEIRLRICGFLFKSTSKTYITPAALVSRVKGLEIFRAEQHTAKGLIADDNGVITFDESLVWCPSVRVFVVNPFAEYNSDVQDKSSVTALMTSNYIGSSLLKEAFLDVMYFHFVFEIHLFPYGAFFLGCNKVEFLDADDSHDPIIRSHLSRTNFFDLSRLRHLKVVFWGDQARDGFTSIFKMRYNANQIVKMLEKFNRHQLLSLEIRFEEGVKRQGCNTGSHCLISPPWWTKQKNCACTDPDADTVPVPGPAPRRIIIPFPLKLTGFSKFGYHDTRPLKADVIATMRLDLDPTDFNDENWELVAAPFLRLRGLAEVQILLPHGAQAASVEQRAVWELQMKGSSAASTEDAFREEFRPDDWAAYVQLGPFTGAKSEASQFPSCEVIADMSVELKEDGVDGLDNKALANTKIDKEQWFDDTTDDAWEEDGDVDWAMDSSDVEDDVGNLSMSGDNNAE